MTRACSWFNDEEFERRQRIVEEVIAEEKEKQRRGAINKKKNELPFSEPLAIEICERVSSGELLINICADEHLPTVRRVTQWLRRTTICLLYKDSINDRLTIFEEEVIKIADDASRDFRDVVRNGRTVQSPRWGRNREGEAARGGQAKAPESVQAIMWGEQSTLNVKSSDQ